MELFSYMVMFEENQVIGRLTYLRPSEKRKYYGVFLCECGKEKEIKLHDVRDKRSLSCGCLRRDLLRDSAIYKPGFVQGSLTIIERVEDHISKGSGSPKPLYKVKCTCGTIKNMLGGVLNHGAQTCGRCNKLGTKNPNYRHGLADTVIDRKYYNMIFRCTNSKHQDYSRYGARGITVCQEWRASKSTYFDWVKGEATKLGLTLDDYFEVDRRDNDKGYSPENCRLVSRLQNANNTRTNVYFYDLFGIEEKITLAEAVRKYCNPTTPYKRVNNRINEGWNPERALVYDYREKDDDYNKPLSEEEKEDFLSRWLTGQI